MGIGTRGECVACAGLQLKVPVIVIMPVNTPVSQQNRLRDAKATIVLAGKDFQEAQRKAEAFAKSHEMCLISMSREPDNLAGVGGIGVELARQADLIDVHAIFVPATSVELITGVSSFIRVVSPWVKVIAVTRNDECVPPSSASSDRKIPSLDAWDEHTAHVTNQLPSAELMNELIRVTVDEVKVAIQDIFEATHSMVKPLGAVGLAGLKAYAQRQAGTVNGKRLVAIVSEGATNFEDLRSIMTLV